jgi:hypothetical protein
MDALKKIIYFLSFLSSIKAFSQTPSFVSIDSLAGRFVKSIRFEYKEKIFLHTDKWFYVAGEELRFRAYCINALSHKISRRSKTVFVDLVDDRDSSVSRLFLNNGEQKLDGDILLSPGLPEGYYWLRAFTGKMLSKDSSNLCVQPVYIFNSKKRTPPLNLAELIKLNGTANLEPPELNFFPEGGSLISGTTTTVAFTSTDKTGQPLSISGYIKDGLDSVVANFKTSMKGIGKFKFFVWKSRKYTAYVKWGDKEIAYPLPIVNQFASQISIAEENGNILRVIVSLGDSLYKKNKPTYLLGLSRDSLCFAAAGTDMYEVFIPKINFPKGRATLILFDEKQRVISERNFFVEKDNLRLNIRSDKERYGPREKTRIDIDVEDSSDRAMVALFSMSVTDDSLAKEPAGLNIANQIVNDNIIFYNANISDSAVRQFTIEQWDLIMLTQKECFAGWKSVPDSSAFSSVNDSITEDNIASINARILDAKNQPVPNRIVTLISNKNMVIFETDTTDKQGRVHFPLPDLPDSTLFVIQVTNLKGVQQRDRIVIQSPEFPNVATPVSLKKRFSPAQESTLNNFKFFQLDTVRIGTGKEWLKEVTVTGHRKKAADFDETKRMSAFSRVVTHEQFDKGGVNALVNSLLLVPGVHLKGGFLVVGGGGGFSAGPDIEPLLVIDGIAVDQNTIIQQWQPKIYPSPIIQYMEQFAPSTIDFIEVLTGGEAAVYGVRAGNGVILINTGTKLRTTAEGTGMVSYYPKGYFNAHEFPMPDYDKKEMKKSSYPDQRSTIYWNGNILTDTKGKASVGFFTSDSKATYTVTIEGISAAGTLIYYRSKINRQ